MPGGRSSLNKQPIKSKNAIPFRGLLTMSSSQSCAGAVSWTTLMIIFVILSSCRGEEVVKAMQRLFPRLGDNGSVTLLGREGDEEENAPEDLEEEVDDVLYHLFGALLLLSMLGMCGCTIYGFYRRFKEQQAAQPVSIPWCWAQHTYCLIT